MSGDIFDYHDCVGRGATGIQWVEARDTAKHPMMHRTARHKESSGPNVSSAKVRNFDLEM